MRWRNWSKIWWLVTRWCGTAARLPERGHLAASRSSARLAVGSWCMLGLMFELYRDGSPILTSAAGLSILAAFAWLHFVFGSYWIRRRATAVRLRQFHLGAGPPDHGPTRRRSFFGHGRASGACGGSVAVWDAKRAAGRPLAEPGPISTPAEMKYALGDLHLYDVVDGRAAPYLVAKPRWDTPGRDSSVSIARGVISMNAFPADYYALAQESLHGRRGGGRPGAILSAQDRLTPAETIRYEVAMLPQSWDGSPGRPDDGGFDPALGLKCRLPEAGLCARSRRTCVPGHCGNPRLLLILKATGPAHCAPFGWEKGSDHETHSSRCRLPRW